MRGLLSYLVPSIKDFILSDGFPCIKHHRNRILHCWLMLLDNPQSIELAPRPGFQVCKKPAVQRLTLSSRSSWDEFESDVELGRDFFRLAAAMGGE
jgi:hypothetical protein